MHIKYADDITILHFSRNASNDCLQSEWNDVICWSESNCLPINRSKYQVMNIITKRCLLPPCVTNLDGVGLDIVNDIALLGVCFSSNFMWNLHFDRIVKKASKRIYSICNLVRSGCPTDLLLQAYFSYIRTILLYSFPTYCNVPDYLMQKQLRIERRICRIIHATPPQDLSAAAEAMCSRLFYRIEGNPSRPLRLSLIHI